ncbi:hypothetical protein ACMAZF_19625 [Psychrobium sp. nBUS_13]|uniref:hypothetical protein n=1 Tax=Psychrobium sp. nBUS_13 TaxID=3395319 RepID=UPI003EBFC7E5
MSLENRAVRYQDLKPCTNAFIDTRSPGSDKKENFTVIGPGLQKTQINMYILALRMVLILVVLVNLPDVLTHSIAI